MKTYKAFDKQHKQVPGLNDYVIHCISDRVPKMIIFII